MNPLSKCPSMTTCEILTPCHKKFQVGIDTVKPSFGSTIPHIEEGKKVKFALANNADKQR
eukprot:5324580-Karenia_brevis.AAC.1